MPVKQEMLFRKVADGKRLEQAFFRDVEVVKVLYMVTLVAMAIADDVYVENVFNGFTVAVERTFRQFVFLTFVQFGNGPSPIDFFACDSV